MIDIRKFAQKKLRAARKLRCLISAVDTLTRAKPEFACTLIRFVGFSAMVDSLPWSKGGLALSGIARNQESV
jgi:hypothetical protein